MGTEEGLFAFSPSLSNVLASPAAVRFCLLPLTLLAYE